MMAAARRAALIDRLPPVRGRYTEGAELARMTWFKVGGPAEVLFRPADVEDLRAFLAARPADVPLTVIGAGSNLLVRDGGVPGVTIRLGRGFTDVAVAGDLMTAGAGTLDHALAMAALQAGLEGLEFLSGIPGSLGGALRMNAGAYGREIKDVFVSARAVDAAGTLRELDGAAMGFAYRHCAVAEDWLFVEATLRGRPGDHGAIAARLDEIRQARTGTQPVGARTGGSTFANPDGPRRAWELIDAAGCRGLRRGGATVSEKHCNFLVNEGGATAADLEGLGEEVRRRVFETSGITLRWEIRRIGVPAAGRPREVDR